MRALYAGEVTMVDAWLGHLLQTLRDVGEWDNTCIVFLSDHGHQLGEHGLTGKVSSGLYPELMDIPLLIKHPRGEEAGKRVDAFVYNLDSFATSLSLLGIAPPVEVAEPRPVAPGEGRPRRSTPGPGAPRSTSSAGSTTTSCCAPPAGATSLAPTAPRPGSTTSRPTLAGRPTSPPTTPR